MSITPPPASPATTAVTATPSEIAAAFALWETKFRANNSAFLTEAECRAMDVADYATGSQIYFCGLLREVQGGAE